MTFGDSEQDIRMTMTSHFSRAFFRRIGDGLSWNEVFRYTPSILANDQINFSDLVPLDSPCCKHVLPRNSINTVGTLCSQPCVDQEPWFNAWCNAHGSSGCMSEGLMNTIASCACRAASSIAQGIYLGMRLDHRQYRDWLNWPHKKPRFAGSSGIYHHLTNFAWYCACTEVEAGQFAGTITNTNGSAAFNQAAREHCLRRYIDILRQNRR